jgi:hypothetical protein
MDIIKDVPIKPIIVHNWEEFEKELQKIYEKRDQIKKGTPMYVSKLLFRGQSNSSWKLETTLERYLLTPLKVTDYFHRIYAAKPQIETHTGNVWNTMTPPDFEGWVKDQGALGLDNMPSYEYMVYLRHNGFPSPLLDWSQSPYIAAFFAFAHASTLTPKVSIYAFLEYAGQGKIGRIDAPRITVRGPYVRSHQRHFLQQCEYTMCTCFRENEWFYASHEEAFIKRPQARGEMQDMIWKFDIPSIERVNVLYLLDKSVVSQC